MGKRFNVDTVQFALGGGSAVLMGCIGSASHANDLQTSPTQSGGPFVEANIATQHNETLRLETMSLRKVLDNLSILGLNCVDVDSDAGDFLALYGQQLTKCGQGGRTSGATHRRVQGTRAIIVVTGIRGDAQGDVTVSIEGALLSADGDAAASVTAYNVALPSSPDHTEKFRRQAPVVAGVTLDPDKVQSVGISTGLSFRLVYGDGNRPISALLIKTAPEVTIATEETDLVDDAKLPLGGKKATHANTRTWWRRRDPSHAGPAGLYAKAAEEHVRITTAGTVKVTETGGAGAEPMTTQVSILCEGDAGAAPLVVTTGLAIA